MCQISVVVEREGEQETVMENVTRLDVIPGRVPDPLRMPAGCRFSDRCPKRIDRCLEEEPPMFDTGGGHLSRCWLSDRST